MSSDEPPISSGAAQEGGHWARTAKWIAIALILTAGVVVLFRSCLAWPERVLQKSADTIQKSRDALATVAAAFHQGTITTSFVSYATTITNTHFLQFATLKQTEIFTRTEEPSTAFGYVPLPDVVVEARAPVEYTYYLDLNAKWNFVIRNGVLEVYAPAIRANRPSVDVSALSYEVKKGHFKTTEALDNLKNTVTSLVILRAKENVPLVRETGRHQTAEFVERWLSRSFTDGKSYPVKVYFPGESPPDQIKLNTGPPH